MPPRFGFRRPAIQKLVVEHADQTPEQVGVCLWPPGNVPVDSAFGDWPAIVTFGAQLPEVAKPLLKAGPDRRRVERVRDRDAGPLVVLPDLPSVGIVQMPREDR